MVWRLQRVFGMFGKFGQNSLVAAGDDLGRACTVGPARPGRSQMLTAGADAFDTACALTFDLMP